MKGGDHLSKGQIFKIVLLVVTIALSAIQGITEMDGDSSTDNGQWHLVKEGFPGEGALLLRFQPL